MKRGYLTSSTVYDAMSIVPREHFVPGISKHLAYADKPLGIKGGQTISAPHMVAAMCDVAELLPGHRVLEVGSGSGYNAAVMATIVKPGIVYSTEVVHSLVHEARSNLAMAGIDNVMVMEHDGSIGLREYAPFDRIMVTCASPGIPDKLVKQLSQDGVLVIPVGDQFLQTLMVVRKDASGKITRQKGMGCVFVPMRGKHGFR